MKNIKKFLLVILALVIGLSITGCVATYTLPDLTGKTTAEVEKIIKKAKLSNCTIKVMSDLLYNDVDYDQATVDNNESLEGMQVYNHDMFYGYAGTYKAGDKIKKDAPLYVYVTASKAPNSTREYLDNFYYGKYDTVSAYDAIESLETLTLPTTVNGEVDRTTTTKTFTTNGFGEVTFVKNVDGDTTKFNDGTTTFSLRYLGVDTPESTASFQAWGKKASHYVENALKPSNCKKIVLEACTPGQADGNGRYLGYVWYQDNSNNWHLLNLELVMFGYAWNKASKDDSLYGSLIVNITDTLRSTGCRVYGQIDPAFDYSTEPKEVTIKDLKENFSSYYAKKVKVTGVVVFKDGNSPVIQDLDHPEYSVYYYIAPWYDKGGMAPIKVGRVITIVGVATYYMPSSLDEEEQELYQDLIGEGDAMGSPQLTDFDKDELEKVIDSTTGKQKVVENVSPAELSLATLLGSTEGSSQKYLGGYTKLTNLIVTEVYSASSSGHTIYCKGSTPQTYQYNIAIRIDDSAFPGQVAEGEVDNGIDGTSFHKNQIITSVVGYLSFYKPYNANYSGFQLVLSSKTDITFQP